MRRLRMGATGTMAGFAAWLMLAAPLAEGAQPAPGSAEQVAAGQAEAGIGQGQPAARDEYVPVYDLPPDEALPAAPMVIGAYAFVWVAFVAYVLTLVNRARKIEADLRALERERG